MSRLAIALKLACLIAALPLASAWAQQESVSSDGAVTSSAKAAVSVSPSFVGTGQRSAARTLTAAEALRFRIARPMTGRRGAESIIGADTRTRTDPTTSFPARAAVHILFSDGTGNFICSGWLISSNTIATAGHCLHPGVGGPPAFYDKTTYTIYPGRNGGTLPYGSCGARRLFSVAGWTNQGRDDFDYGAIKLNCAIGNTVGWFGFFWQAATLNGITATISGYPGDKPTGEQWRSKGPVTVTQARRVFYKNDTIGGMSGSPVYYNRSASCRVCSMAIHAYGVYNGPPYNANNHGTRINQEVFNNLIAWRNAP